MDGALSVAALFSTSSLTSFWTLPVPDRFAYTASRNVYSRSPRRTSGKPVLYPPDSCYWTLPAKPHCFSYCRKLPVLCASSRLNDTFSTAHRLRAASGWVSKVAIVVLFPATQVTLSPGVKSKAIAGFTITSSTSYPLASAQGSDNPFS